MQATKIQIFAGIFALIFAFIVVYLTTVNRSGIPQIQKAVITASTTLPTFTIAQLALHNGSDASLPIYIALDGYVYDVTQGKKFYQSGGVYHYLAGKDSSNTLHIMGGATIKQKYPIVGVFVDK